MRTMLIQNREFEDCKEIGKKEGVEVHEAKREGEKCYRPGPRKQEKIPEGHLAIGLRARSPQHLLSFFRRVREARNEKYSIA